MLGTGPVTAGGWMGGVGEGSGVGGGWGAKWFCRGGSGGRGLLVEYL